MSIIDKTVAFFSPSRGLQREVARHRLEQIKKLRRGYDGADSTSRRSERKILTPSSANSETLRALAKLRSRTREFTRNNPFARAAVRLLVAYQVGTGITPRSNTGDPELDKLADEHWAIFAKQANLNKKGNIYSLQNLAARTRAESGEAVFKRVRYTRAQAESRGLLIPLQYQLLEPDYIDTTKDTSFSSRGLNNNVQGIDVDSNGTPTGYWLLTGHPGDSATTALPGNSVRLPQEDIIHLFRQERPGQIRGTPDFCSVLNRLSQLDRFEDAALEQALVQACLAVFVEQQASPAESNIGRGTVNENGEREESLAPGMVTYLQPGEKIQAVTPGYNSQGMRDMARHFLTSIAAGVGITYDILTGDLTQANYSSLRAGRLAFKRLLEDDQWLMFEPDMCTPMWDDFISAAQLMKRLPLKNHWPVEWTFPRFEMLDPESETMAEIMQIRAGLKTYKMSLQENGFNYREMIEEIAELNKLFDTSGVILDIDPRRFSRSGNSNDAKSNSAVELSAKDGGKSPTKPAARTLIAHPGGLRGEG